MDLIFRLPVKFFFNHLNFYYTTPFPTLPLNSSSYHFIRQSTTSSVTQLINPSLFHFILIPNPISNFTNSSLNIPLHPPSIISSFTLPLPHSFHNLILSFTTESPILPLHSSHYYIIPDHATSSVSPQVHLPLDHFAEHFTVSVYTSDHFFADLLRKCSVSHLGGAE